MTGGPGREKNYAWHVTVPREHPGFHEESSALLIELDMESLD